MNLNRRLFSLVFYGFGILSIIVVAVYGLLYYGYTNYNSPVYNAVVALPDDYPNQNFSSYSGPHPKDLIRPNDNFSYPIEAGQIGPVEPLWSGPLQYPFACMTERSNLGQPQVDNEQGVGIPVFDLDAAGKRTNNIRGYSKDCLVATRVVYYSQNTDTGLFAPIGDIPLTKRLTQNGEVLRFRVEVGTINRYIYLMFMPAGPEDTVLQADTSLWNNQLIYQFRGGVGIGKRQGRLSVAGMLKRRVKELKQGYALVYSTANQTSNHYNMWIAEEVAFRLKRNFVARFGQPEFTIGVGGSGGAIQQFLIAQNHPGILDGIIPLYAYPDMVSQIIYAYDCELLEYYFDRESKDNPLWHDWSLRQKIQGLNARKIPPERFKYAIVAARLIHGIQPYQPEGSSECINGWRGLTPLTNNPRFVHFSEYYNEDVRKQTHWTHWDDLKQFYGTNDAGFANQTWGNVGIQYGLQAMVSGDLKPSDFLHLNASVGSWKPAAQQSPERFGFLSDNRYFWKLSPWSHHNISSGSLTHPASRLEASGEAIRGAFQSGHVFLGNIDIPIIDLRHYLDDELDMHHFSASFSTRSRLKAARGKHDNHVIWVTRKPHTPVNEAFKLMTDWLRNEGATAAVDTCFTELGEVLASGKGVWDGNWNQKPSGTCMKHYPIYSDSRQAAGANIRGNVFKCQLQTISEAMAAGVYGQVNMGAHVAQLEKIFPKGVCDFSKPDFAYSVLP